MFPLGANGIIWTLSVEVSCYLLAPFLVRLDKKVILSLIGIPSSCYILFLQLDIPNKDIAFLRYGLPFILLLWVWLLGFFYFFNADKNWAKALLTLLEYFLLGFHGGNGQFATFTYSLSALALIYPSSISLPESLLKAFNYLGELSYPLYLFHTLAILLGYAFLGFRSSFSLFVLCLLFSAFFYHVVDVPSHIRKA